MSLYGFNIIMVDGKLYAHAGTQNEWTGNVRYAFKKVFQKEGMYYFKSDNQAHVCTSAVLSHMKQEHQRKEEHEFYLKYKGRIF